VSTTTTPYGVIITETEDSISFRLPSWLADDERARIRSELDEWWSLSGGRAHGANGVMWQRFPSVNASTSMTALLSTPTKSNWCTVWPGLIVAD